MNHLYRLVWNRQLNAPVAVAENAGSGGKAGTPRRRGVAGGFRARLAPVAGAVLLALGLAPTWTMALPSGARVTSGQAGVSQSGSTLTVTQSSQKAIVNWDSFGIGSGETVTFHQPGRSSVALNRVLGSNASDIYGSLNANGQVFLVNPNGVYFAPGAQVNVGGIVASTLNISDADFLSGHYTFSGNSSASVQNDGTITTAQGGYVAFIGNHVANDGSISTPGGATALGAGESVTLTLAGNNLLSFKVSGATLNALAENGGLIRADGGTVILSVEAKDALLKTVLNNSGVIQAQTAENHNGTIELLGGDSGTAVVSGTLDASAPATGDGGFIETSGAHLKVADGATITTEASSGSNGNWLIDPYDFTIAVSGGDISGSALSTALGSADVTIQTTSTGVSCTSATCGSGTGSGNGDIFVNDTVSWSADTTLTLSAYRNIDLNRSITATGSGYNNNNSSFRRLVLAYNQGGGGGTYHVRAPMNLPAGWQHFSTNNHGTVTDYYVITSLGSAADATTAPSTMTLQGLAVWGGAIHTYVLGADIDATATSGWNSSQGFTPIGTNSTYPFSGTLDGLGHTISNLTINRTSTSGVGLFGYASYANIRNFGLVGGNIHGSNYVGSIVGNSANSTISNAYATSGVSGRGDVGGLVGFNGGLITNAYATGSVNGSTNVGGLVGVNSNNTNNNGRIYNAYATGIVTGSSVVGGLVGDSYADTISNVYATGNVNGSTNVGGVLGNTMYGTISNAYATGSVSGTTNVGGVAGRVYAATASHTYWDTTTSGATTGIASGNTAGATGLTATQMQQQASFSGYDFTNAWVIYDGHTTPLLRGLMTPLTVTAGARTKTYDGSSSVTLSSPTYSVPAADTSGHLLGLSNPYGSNAVNVGSYSADLWSDQHGYIITQSGVGALTITPKTLGVSGVSASNKVYDGTTVDDINTAGASLTGMVGTDSVSLGSGTGAGTFASANAGTALAVTASLTLTGTSAGNYTLAQPTGLSADITPKALSLSGLAVNNKVYDGTSAATVSLFGSLSGMVTGDSANVTLDSSSASAAFVDVNAGAGKTVIVGGLALTGTSAGNYSLGTQSTTADITPKALSLSGLTAANKVYDGNAAATISSYGTLSGVVSGDSLNVSLDGSGSSAAFSDANAATGKTVTVSSLALSGSAAGNYSLLSTQTTSADITRKALSLSGLITANNKVYDGTASDDLNTAGASLTGVLGTDSVSLGSGTGAGTFASANAGTGLAVTAGLSLTGTSAGNYTLTQPTGLSADITPKVLGLSGMRVADKVYDGTIAATVSRYGSLVGVVAGDGVSLNSAGAVASFADPGVGRDKPVTVVGLALAGASAGNYTLGGQGTAASILPAANFGGSDSIGKLMQQGYTVPVSGPTLLLAPVTYTQQVQAPAKPTKVELEAAEGGVSAPARPCTGTAEIDAFDSASGALICGGS